MAGAGIDWVPAPSAVLAPASHHRVTGAVLGMAIAIAVHHIAVHHTVAAPSFGRPRSLIILHGRTLALYRARQSRRNSRPGSTKRPGRPYPMSRWTRRPLARIRSAKGGSVRADELAAARNALEEARRQAARSAPGTEEPTEAFDPARVAYEMELAEHRSTTERLHHAELAARRPDDWLPAGIYRRAAGRSGPPSYRPPGC